MTLLWVVEQLGLLVKISEKETAKKMIDEIWQCKNFANAIEMELIRRGFYNGATS